MVGRKSYATERRLALFRRDGSEEGFSPPNDAGRCEPHGVRLSEVPSLVLAVV